MPIERKYTVWFGYKKPRQKYYVTVAFLAGLSTSRKRVYTLASSFCSSL